MSAYVVEPKMISRIVCWLDLYDYKQQRSDVLLAAEIKPGAVIDWKEQLQAVMFQMNIDAVRARYSDADAAEMIPHDSPFSFVCATSIQILKSLGCYLYQCSEGEVPQTPLYKALRQAEHDLALEIIGRLPEYEKASWA